MTIMIVAMDCRGPRWACVSAHAQTYPTREIRVVVGLPAGSGGDVVARFYADKLSQVSGKPVIVENKPGMILSIGADAVAKAPPDGYTILITSVTSSHAANLFNFKKLPYDPIKDFTPVAMLQKSYFILMVRAEAPWKTVAELTEAMKEKGDKASYGYGSPPALASAELYKARAGLQAVGIPYRTSMASLPEMFSGELDFQFIDATQGTPLLQGGKLRGLAVTSGQRVPGVDIPDHGGSRRHPGIRHRAGLGRVPAGRRARTDRGAAGILVRRDQRTWTPPGSFLPTPMARRFRAAPRISLPSSRRKSRSGRSSPSSRKSSRNEAEARWETHRRKSWKHGQSKIRRSGRTNRSASRLRSARRRCIQRRMRKSRN